MEEVKTSFLCGQCNEPIGWSGWCSCVYCSHSEVVPCGSQYKLHCVLCGFPFCGEHITKNEYRCEDGYSRKSCSKCHNQYQLFLHAGDKERGQMLERQNANNPFLPSESVPSTETRVTRVTKDNQEKFNPQKMRSSRQTVRVMSEKQQHQVEIENELHLSWHTLERMIYHHIQTESSIHTSYDIVEENGVLVVHANEPILAVVPQSPSSVLIYQLLVDSPYIKPSKRISETVLASWINYVQPNMENLYSDEGMLIPVLETLLEHYRQFSPQLHSLWESNKVHALSWERGIASYNTLRADTPKLGSAIDYQIKQSWKSLSENIEVTIPIIWRQSYPQQDSDTLWSTDCFWAFIEPTLVVDDNSSTEREFESLKNSFTLSLVNTSSLFSSLFPTSEQDHINHWERKYPKDLFEGEEMLCPGTIGTANHIRFQNISKDILERILLCLYVMQSQKQQRNPGKASSFSFSSMGLKDLMIAREISSGGKLHNVEEKLSDQRFDSRSLLDGTLFEGHTIHILEFILYTLHQNPGIHSNVDNSSVYPLRPNFPPTKSISLMERFRFGKSTQRKIQISRLFFLLRHLPLYDASLLRDASQSLFLLANANISLFSEDLVLQRKELNVLHSFIDVLFESARFSIVPLKSIGTAHSDEIFLPVPPFEEKSQTSGATFLLNQRKRSLLPLCGIDLVSYFKEKIPFNCFESLWADWFKEAEAISTKEMTTSMIMYQAMVDSLPEFNDEYWKQPNPENESLVAWLDHWALLVHRIIVFISSYMLRRLGITLESFTFFNKRGSSPDESWNLIKCNAILLQIALHPSQPIQRPYLDINYGSLLKEDHYCHFYSAQKNQLFAQMVQFLGKSSSINLDTKYHNNFSNITMHSSLNRYAIERMKIVCGKLPLPFPQKEHTSSPPSIHIPPQKIHIYTVGATEGYNATLGWLKDVIPILEPILCKEVTEWISQVFESTQIVFMHKKCTVLHNCLGFNTLPLDHLHEEVNYEERMAQTALIMNALATPDSFSRIKLRAILQDILKELEDIVHSLYQNAQEIFQFTLLCTVSHFLNIKPPSTTFEVDQSKFNHAINIQTRQLMKKCATVFHSSILFAGHLSFENPCMDNVFPVRKEIDHTKMIVPPAPEGDENCVQDFFEKYRAGSMYIPTVLSNDTSTISYDDLSSKERNLCLQHPMFHAFLPASWYALVSGSMLLKTALINRKGFTYSMLKEWISIGGLACEAGIDFFCNSMKKRSHYRHKMIYSITKRFKDSLQKIVCPSIEFTESDVVVQLGTEYIYALDMGSQEARHSHYSHGVQLSSTIRERLLRTAIEEKEGKFPHVFSPDLTLLPAMDGETDEIQNICFDYLSTTWCDGLLFNIYDPEFQHMLKVDVGIMNNSKAPAYTAITALHVILGAFSMDRLYYFLSEPSLQWTLELLVFRPGTLPFLARQNPEFLPALKIVVGKAISIQNTIHHIAHELYLRKFLHRISEEVKHVDTPIVTQFINDMNEPEYAFGSRVTELYQSLLSHYQTPTHSTSYLRVPEAQEKLLEHSISIHFYFLIYMKQTYPSIQLTRENEQIVGLLFISSILLRTEMETSPDDEVDRYLIQSIRQWICSRMEHWKSSLLVGSEVNQEIMQLLLFPTIKYFLGTKIKNQTAWNCNAFPLFECRVEREGVQIDVAVDVALGYLFIDGKAQSFIRRVVTEQKIYQQFFGARNFLCSVEKSPDMDCYFLDFQHPTNRNTSRYCITNTIKTDTVRVYRHIEEQWYQLFVEEFASLDHVVSLPSFITSSLIWIRLSIVNGYFGQGTTGAIFFSAPSITPEQSILSYFCSVTKKEDHLFASQISRYPTKESIKFLPNKKTPCVLKDFEHGRFIEYTTESITLTRYKLTFGYDKTTRLWMSLEYPGYYIYESHQLNPLKDTSRFWLPLCSTMSGESSFLMIGSDYKLLDYDPDVSDENNKQCYRTRTRNVWKDMDLLSNISRTYFIIQSDPEYPSVLYTSQAHDTCWLLGLYFAKRHYVACAALLPAAINPSSIQIQQLVHIRHILKWRDHSKNACSLKLKIIAILVQFDLNLFENTSKEEGNTLGLTQREWANLFLLAGRKLKFSGLHSSSTPFFTSSSSIQKERPLDGISIQVTDAEWYQIQRGFNRFSKSAPLLGALHSVPSVSPFSCVGDCFSRIEEMSSTILCTVSDYDIAEEINTYHAYPSQICSHLDFIPLVLGRSGRDIVRYFKTIYLYLDNEAVTEGEYELWKTLLACEPTVGDQVVRQVRIFLLRAVAQRLVSGKLYIPRTWALDEIETLLHSLRQHFLFSITPPSFSIPTIPIPPIPTYNIPKGWTLSHEIETLEKKILPPTPPLPSNYFDEAEIHCEELENICGEFLIYNETPIDEKGWKQRSEELFHKDHFAQLQHQRYATALQKGFDHAWDKKDYSIQFVTTSDTSRILDGMDARSNLLTQLYSLRKKLEEKEHVHLTDLFACIEIGCTTTTNILPTIPVLMNLWENDELNKLTTLFSLTITTKDLSSLETILEDLILNTCWRFHLNNVLKKFHQIQECHSTVEKADLRKHLYTMFHETICYTKDSTHKHNRKILALCRMNKFLVRKNQVVIVNSLYQNPNQAVQAALGLGKSSVVVPLLTDALANGRECTWIICTQADKADTISRAEKSCLVLNHPVMVFHFSEDSTIKNVDNLVVPYELNSIEALQRLYYDLLQATVNKGIVITTKESLLYFVDTYEFLWIQQATHMTLPDSPILQRQTNLLNFYGKFFPFFKKHCRAVLDEIDEILKANVKVNLALSNMAKINRDTLDLAVRCVRILFNPSITIDIPDSEGIILRVPLPNAIPLIHNCQAATSPFIKQLAKEKIAEIIGIEYFHFKANSSTYKDYLAFILHLDTSDATRFYSTFICNRENKDAANYIRLRELLGSSFALLFKRHNYSIGRMFSNSNPDDVGPYSAANTPIINAHLSSEYDWVWALATNYAMMGCTEQQCARLINQARVNHSLGGKTSKVEELCDFLDMNLFSITKEEIPVITKHLNEIGSWNSLAHKKLIQLQETIKNEHQELYNDICSRYPTFSGELRELCEQELNFLANHLFHRVTPLFTSTLWNDILSSISMDDSIGRKEEEKLIEKFLSGIDSRLTFLLEFVNLNYYPQFVEGNANTLIHLFQSACGFSGTMEVPLSLPQKLYQASDTSLLQDTSINGIVLSRFLTFAHAPQFGAKFNDLTSYVDDAAKIGIRRARLYSYTDKSCDFIKGNTERVLYACFDALAIVDGGALLDVDPTEVIYTLLRDHGNVLESIGDPSSGYIKTVRWKDKRGRWSTVDIPADPQNPIFILESHRTSPLDLSRTLTFYDQQHSRGTDAILASNACMVNTVGDETRLTEWLQAEGRARQSGKGQTSRTVIASHIRDQQYGKGSLSIQLLRTLIRRSANSQVSETFYSHSEQIMSYTRDLIRSALSECTSRSLLTTDRRILSRLAEFLFTKSCTIDLSHFENRIKTGRPFEFTSSLNCLIIVKEQAVQTLSLLKDLIAPLSSGVKNIMEKAMCRCLKIIQDHQFPLEEYLPAGMVGIPKPGENSSAVVISTEQEQENAIDIEQETEVETDHQIDLELNKNNSKKSQTNRPSYTPWPLDATSSLEKFWKSMESNPFIPLDFQGLYRKSFISCNLGIEPEGSSCELDSNENQFEWLHNPIVEPFCYHIVVRNVEAQENRVVTISRGEYSNLWFTTIFENHENWQYAVFRHMGWGWVRLEGFPNTLSVYECSLCLSECALLSGAVDLGDEETQIYFLDLFRMTEELTQSVGEMVLQYVQRKTHEQPAFSNETQSFLCEVKHAIDCAKERIANTECSKQFHKEFIAGVEPSQLVAYLMKRRDLRVSSVLLKHIKSLHKPTFWKNVIKGMFGSKEKQHLICTALCQVKEIASRHRPGISKKLGTAPMVQILSGLVLIE